MRASPTLVNAFAPSGELKASINLGNPILAGLRPGTETPTGVSVDLASELGRRLGVKVCHVMFKTALESVEAVRGGQADIGFFAIDPLRSDGIGFTAPYVLIEGAYLVTDESPIRANEEVDQKHHRVVVGKGSAYDLFLTRELKQAQIVRAPSSPAVVDVFIGQGAHVAAGVKQQLQADQARFPNTRLLPGRFMVIQQAMGLPANRGEDARAFLTAFVEEMKRSGFVAEALARHNIKGASVAPLA
jgi:polar amino acid transport system substrate-binding protein